MTPKQFIRYTQMLDRKGLAICDGMTASYSSSIFNILYPVFVVSGIAIFLGVIVYWTEIKERIRRK